MFSYFVQRPISLTLDGTLPSFTESRTISVAAKEINEKAVASPQVVQPIVTPKKKRTNTAIIGTIDSDLKQQVAFEPVFQIDDSLLQSASSTGSLATMPGQEAVLPPVAEV